jgi:hypothetical protein
MKMNMPTLEGKSFLIAGAGGGFDVFGGIPLAYELLRSDAKVVLANFSIKSQGFSVRESTEEDYPEGDLKNVGIPVYTFGKNGVQNLRAAYEELIAKHEVETVVLVDGGVDSLMRGDEVGYGTVLEDSISLAAVAQLSVPFKYLVCLGFGTEIEEGLNHYRVLENMTRCGLLGCCALTKEMEAFQVYERACHAVWQKGRKSHIHSRIIPAVRGKFGDFRMAGVEANVNGAEDKPLFVSVLSTLYWFFDLNNVADESYIIPTIIESKIFTDAMLLFRQMDAPNRSKEPIPL